MLGLALAACVAGTFTGPDPSATPADRGSATPAYEGSATPAGTAPAALATGAPPPAGPTPVSSEHTLTEVQGTLALEGGGDPAGADIRAFLLSEQVRAETVVQGLEVPWGLAFTPDGRILVTERPGRIRVVRDGTLQPEPFATLEVAHVSEAGLMGIALHPDFAANGHLYVCYTYLNDGGALRNRVARLTDRDGVGRRHTVILDNIPGATRHDGCRLGFGPDENLYVTMGDATNGGLAQDLHSLAGKVLRLHADGSVPEDNPFPGSPVYTYGHRNPQGLDWHPITGDAFITEHGPNADDEVNILEVGANYGWPETTGNSGNPRYRDPILSFTPTVAPAGAAFYTGGRLAEPWRGNFIFAVLKDQFLGRVTLAPPDFRQVEGQERLFEGELGRLRAVAVAPDGYLYFTTSNRDGRGNPRREDDRLLRLVPDRVVEAKAINPSPQGDFTLNLSPGTYLLRFEMDGFIPQERRVVAGPVEQVDLGRIELEPGE